MQGISALVPESATLRGVERRVSHGFEPGYFMTGTCACCMFHFKYNPYGGSDRGFTYTAADVYNTSEQGTCLHCSFRLKGASQRAQEQFKWQFDCRSCRRLFKVHKKNGSQLRFLGQCCDECFDAEVARVEPPFIRRLRVMHQRDDEQHSSQPAHRCVDLTTSDGSISDADLAHVDGLVAEHMQRRCNMQVAGVARARMQGRAGLFRDGLGDTQFL